MIGKLKKIKPSILISHVIITLAYPAVKAFTATGNRLLAFTDILTIVALILLIVGIIYSAVLHGYLDISSYYLQRGVRSFKFFDRHSSEQSKNQSIGEFLQENRDKRADAFNYPLFLGVIYLIVSVVIAYGIY